MARRSQLILYLLGAATSVLLALLSAVELPLLHGMELSARDVLSDVGRKTPPNPKLLFLAIDDASMTLDPEADLQGLFTMEQAASSDMRALQLMSAGWPWPREIYALVLDRLIAAGARGVIFDLNFPTESEYDAAFRAALDRHAGKVVIASNFVAGTDGRSVKLTSPSPSLIGDSLDPRIGFANFWPDIDAVVREARPSITLEEASGGAALPESDVLHSLAARGLQLSGLPELANSRGPHIIRYTARPYLGFPARSIFEIFVPDYWQRNYGGGALFQDAIVVVGAAGNWQHDEHLTPLGVMPGPEVQLNALNSLLQREVLVPLSRTYQTALVLLAGTAALTLGRVVRAALLRVVLFTLLICVWGLIAYAFFNAGTLIPLTAPLLAFGINGFFGLTHDFSMERLERSRMRRTLERYVSRDIVHQLVDNPATFKASLGGATRPVTILFSDIRDFSGLTVNTEAHELVAQLNEYLTAMVDCVFRNGGTLDKFIGDAVMAVWGNTTTQGAQEDTLSAVHAAFAMRTELERLNARWRERGSTELQIGIAVNHGDVVVGNIGSPQRMEYTVIGDAVNLTARLQGLTKKVGTGLIVGETAAALVRDHFEVEPLGEFELAGQRQPVKAFSVKPKSPTARDSEPATAAFAS
jgi:adenylate cyclase